MSDVRYVLHPGQIRSINDGDNHYIGVGQLRSLYLVPPNAHVIVCPPYGDSDRIFFDATYRKRPGDIHCFPRYHHTGYPRFMEESHV